MSMSSSGQAKVLRSAGRKAEAAQDIVFRWLKQHIVTLPRGAGVFLTEAEVCRATGTSRTPVREALLRLEADGFLEIVPKKGAYVAPITEADIETVMQARKLVEEWCASRASALGDPLARELGRLVEQQAELMGDPVAFVESDRLFHRAIVSAAGNPVLVGFYESLRDRQLRMGVHAVATSDQRSNDVLGEHRAIVAAIRMGDPEEAAAAMARHLATTLAALRMPIIRPLERSFQT
jgi:DNA-binding GntR family transcriptional regulator